MSRNLDHNWQQALQKTSAERRIGVQSVDDLLAPGATRDGLGKGIEVHHHQIDRTDLMFFHRRDMLCIVAHREQPAMDLRVERLDPAAEYLRRAGELGRKRGGASLINQLIRWIADTVKWIGKPGNAR